MPKLSDITTGGTVNPATDEIVVVRNGNTDELVTAGTASTKAASGTGGVVASVSGSTVAGHLASFADTSGTVQDASLGVENKFIGTTFVSELDFAEYTNITAGADVTTLITDFGISRHLNCIKRGALSKSNQGGRVRDKGRCLVSFPLTLTSPYISLPFTDMDFPEQILRSVPGGGSITNFYNGDTTSKALTNLYQPTIYASLLSHMAETDTNNNPDNVNYGAGFFGPRGWVMAGSGFAVGSQGSGGYTNGDHVSILIGGLQSPFVAATFSLTVSAGNVTGLTLIQGGIYPAPPKILRKMWGDPTVGWTNPITGGTTWASLVTTGLVSAVFDASGYWVTTGGTGTGLTINIADDTTCWTPDFAGGDSANLFQANQCDTVLGNVKVANCGITTDATYGPMRAFCLTGLDHVASSIETNGGYYGIASYATDAKIDKMHPVKGFCNYKKFSGGNEYCVEMSLDTPLDHYAEIDNTQGDVLKGRCFNNGSVNQTGAYAFRIGSNGSSSSSQVRGVEVDFEFSNAGNSTGIPAAVIANIQGSSINFDITNIDSKTGAAAIYRISSFANFGSGIANNNKFTGRIDGVFGQIYSGTLPTCLLNIWDAEAPLQYGSVTATIGGTATNGDSIAFTFTNIGIFGFPQTVTVPITTSETTTAMATAAVAAFNAATALTNFGLSAKSSANVVTIYQSGSQANNTVVTASVTGSSTETVAFSNSGAISGAVSGGTFGVDGVYSMIGQGAPVSGTTQSTGLNKAISGSTYLDQTNGDYYINEGSAANPLWKVDITTLTSAYYQMVGTRCGMNGPGGNLSGAGQESRIQHYLPWGALDAYPIYPGYSVTATNPVKEIPFTASSGFKAVSVTVNTGSATGYAAGDMYTATVANGDVSPIVSIDAVTGGVPTAWTVIEPGILHVEPSAALTQASAIVGSGTGATFTFTCAASGYGFNMGLEQAWGTQTALSTSNLTGVLKLTSGATSYGSNGNIFVPPGGFSQIDPVFLNAPPGTTIGSRIWTPSDQLPVGRYLSGSAGANEESHASETSGLSPVWGGTMLTHASPAPGYQPVAIMGRLPVPKPSFAIIGDSIAYGATSVASATGGTTSHDTLDTNLNSGWIERAANRQVIWTNFSTPNEQLANWLVQPGFKVGAGLRMKTLELIRPSHIVEEMQVNDFNSGGVSFSQMLANKIAFWAWLMSIGAKEIWTPTCSPNPSSTSGIAALPTIASGGSGYANSSTFIVTLAGGTQSLGAAQVSVTTNSSGVVTTVNSIVNIGYYTALPAATNSATGGAGTGLSLTCVFGKCLDQTSQSVGAGNAATQLWNTWLRAGNATAYGVTRVLDLGTDVESTIGNGLWPSGASLDGLHLTQSQTAVVASHQAAQFATATL